jgi:acyl carrier protein
MEIKSLLRQFLRATFQLKEPAALSDDTSLLDSGLIDSMGVLELVMFLETEFGISLGDEEVVAENLDTIERITTFVVSKRRGAHAY